VFFYLDSENLAIERVKNRVIEGGHYIPKPVIIRRYFSGLRNLFKLYVPFCDYCMLFDSSKLQSELIAEGYLSGEIDIKNIRTFESIKSKIENDKKR
jgi:predicted ABC-type ATPase